MHKMSRVIRSAAKRRKTSKRKRNYGLALELLLLVLHWIPFVVPLLVEFTRPS